MEHVTEPNFISTLGLNWKLFLAQLINFGIVVLILWKWVMKPVAGALEERRKKVEDSVKKAEEIEMRVKEFEARRARDLKQAHAKGEKILLESRAVGERLRSEIVESAKRESAKILTEAKLKIDADKEKMFQEIKEEVANLTVMVAEKIIREKLDDAKDRKMVEEMLRNMD